MNLKKYNQMKCKIIKIGNTLKKVFEVMTYISLFFDFLKWYNWFMPFI